MKFVKRFLFAPPQGVDWAEKMVLNPAITADPDNADTLHMLFRATGPYAGKQQGSGPLPYPIFLGYAVSRDGGRSFECDFSRPAMLPALRSELAELRTKDAFGRGMWDYSNGCIEDPRLFYFEKELYLTVACRAFPPGPYWEHDDPVQCMPEAVRNEGANPGAAIAKNSTVTLLYKVNLAKLTARDYEHAFTFVTPLHQPDVSDDRDVVLFPRRLRIGGKDKIVCLHRPKNPWKYAVGVKVAKPSIFIALADSLADFYSGEAEEYVFAEPRYEWESDRIGVSWAPLEYEAGKWLLPYHGKQDDVTGYTQSFMLLEEDEAGLPRIVSRPEGRMLYADEEWELGGDFATPCLFSCSGVLMADGRLLMGYGAADAKVGMAECDYLELLKYLKG